MFISTTRAMFPSAKALANAISRIAGKPIKVTAKDVSSLSGNYVSWGRSTPPNSFAHPLSDISLIGVASNKLQFSLAMTPYGIPCVELYYPSDRVPYPERYPVVIRKTVTGFGGAGIIVATNEEEWYPHRYSAWSYFYDMSPELGVHVFNGEIIKVFKKVNPNPDPELYPIRNATRGYDFSLVNIVNFPKLIPFVHNFCEKFPILMGRMDVGWDRLSKTYRVIEFNTAPCLTKNQDTLNRYAESIWNTFHE